MTDPALLSIRTILSALTRIIKSEWRTLLKIFLLPCAVIALTGAMVPVNKYHTENNQAIVFNLMFFLANVLLQPWLAVTTLRFLVMGEEPRAWWHYYDPRMWRYLWKSIVMGFALAMPVLVLGGLGFAIFPQIMAIICLLLLVLAASLASGRVLLAMPASALQDDNSLKTAWRKTRGQALRILTIKCLGQLMLLMLMIPFLFFVLIAVVLGQISPILAKFISVWALTILQLLVLLPIDALLYGYFYGDVVVNQTEKDESHGS